MFALGVVLAFAGGVRPFGEGLAAAIDYRVVHAEPDVEGLDPIIRGVVAKCLAKEPEARPTPAWILECLAGDDGPGPWLPEAVHDMIKACAPPPELLAETSPLDSTRLMAEAEQIARALPDDEERSIALLHIAAAVCPADPAHAARLLSDIRYPAVRAAEAGAPWRPPAMEYLIESCPAEVGTVVGGIDPVAADQLLADIAAHSRVLTLRHMGSEEETAKVLTTIAEAAASASPDRADRIARLVYDESWQAMAIARAAMVAAYTDPARAEQMIATIRSRFEAADKKGEGRANRGRRQPRVPLAAAPASAHDDHDVARYWAAVALAETAAAVRRRRARSGRADGLLTPGTSPAPFSAGCLSPAPTLSPGDAGRPRESIMHRGEFAWPTLRAASPPRPACSSHRFRRGGRSTSRAAGLTRRRRERPSSIPPHRPVPVCCRQTGRSSDQR